MPEIPRAQVLLYAAVVAAVAFLGARALAPRTLAEPPADAGGGRPTTSQDGASTGPSASVAVPPGSRLAVHVAGAVRRPGVYRLREGQRVGDAVKRAGGGRPGADLDAVNLAAKVTDGQQVLVPRRTTAAAPGAAAASPGETTAPGVPVNLNTATLEQLDTLDGVGPATAQKILDERTKRGGFRSVEDLASVPGIGPKRLAALRDEVRV